MNPKKVAIISLYIDEVKDVPPLGPLYLATALKKNGTECLIVHENANKIEDIIRRVREFNPDLIGMSVFTGYNNKKYADLGREFKKCGYKVVLGNAHASLLPRDSLKEDYVDFVIIGEGEETLVELVNALDDPASYSSILGLGFKNEDGGIVINEVRNFIANLDDYMIDWSLINVEDYLIPYFGNKCKRVFTVTTSRGCPFNCQFCYNMVFNKRRWRAHSVDRIIANLQPLIDRYKIDGLRFYDDNFFVDKDRSFKIVSAFNLPYLAEARVEYITTDFVKRLQETKCQEILFGFESGSDRILAEVVQKGSSTADIVKAVSLFNNSGVVASGSFIFGYPSESKDDYRETMRFIVKLLEINKNLAFTCGWFLPYPGTGLYEKAKERGFVPPDRIEDWDKMNRWSQSFDMPWVGWDNKRAMKFSRSSINLLAMAYKNNISFIKKILRYRVENLNFSWPFDLYIFSRIRDIYLFSGEKTAFNHWVKKVISVIVAIQGKKGPIKNVGAPAKARATYKNKEQLIFSLIGKDDIVLDVGFYGQGKSYAASDSPHQIIKMLAADVYGIDLNLPDDFIAAKSADHYFNLSAENFNLGKKFDVIFAGDLLEHLSNPGLFLDACRKNLQANGRLIITTPNCFNLFNLAEKISKVEPTVNHDHTCYFNFKTIKQLLLKNDFMIADWGYVYSLDCDYRKSIKKKFLDVIYYFLSFFTDKFMETLFVVAKNK